MISKLKFLHLAALIALLGGCGHLVSDKCAVHDWYEQGRIDGSQGHSQDRFSHHVKRCENPTEEPHTLYKNGWNAGLTQYCSPQNGFELGSAGRPYSKVCPSMLEKEFLVRYEQGLKLLRLEQANAQIEREVAELKAKAPQRLIASSQPEVHQQISQLLALRKSNREEIQKIRESVSISL